MPGYDLEPEKSQDVAKHPADLWALCQSYNDKPESVLFRSVTEHKTLFGFASSAASDTKAIQRF